MTWRGVSAWPLQWLLRDITKADSYGGKISVAAMLCDSVASMASAASLERIT